MFGLFKNKKQPSGAELAEEGLKQIAIAIKKDAIKLEQGRIFNDIYVHADFPNSTPTCTGSLATTN